MDGKFYTKDVNPAASLGFNVRQGRPARRRARLGVNGKHFNVLLGKNGRCMNLPALTAFGRSMTSVTLTTISHQSLHRGRRGELHDVGASGVAPKVTGTEPRHRSPCPLGHGHGPSATALGSAAAGPISGIAAGNNRRRQCNVYWHRRRQ